jgi:hypothetical protein
MVRENDEVACFQYVAEMLHDLLDSQQFAIVSAVFLLCQIEFLGEEGEGLSGVVNPFLQYGINGGSGGVRDECKCLSWVGVCQ